MTFWMITGMLLDERQDLLQWWHMTLDVEALRPKWGWAVRIKGLLNCQRYFWIKATHMHFFCCCHIFPCHAYPEICFLFWMEYPLDPSYLIADWSNVPLHLSPYFRLAQETTWLCASVNHLISYPYVCTHNCWFVHLGICRQSPMYSNII